MSTERDEETLVQKSTEGAKNKEATKLVNKGKSKKATMKSRPVGMDPYIRNLLGIAALVIIGALLTIVFAVLTGVIDFDQTRPTTIHEHGVARARVYADTENTAGSTGQLIIALIESNQLLEAEMLAQEALQREWPDTERNQGIMFAYAMLAEAQGDADTAIERYVYVRQNLRADFDRMYETDVEPNWARGFGMHPNYYEAALSLASIYADREDLANQIEMLDVALEGFPTAGDLLIWRGQALLDQGDNEGAIQDFARALRFLPGDEEAVRGLEAAGGIEAGGIAND